MARKKKHQHHEEHVDESWLIPYADLLTLLLALFIVLFAASSIDMKKFYQLANSFNSQFTGGTGVMEYQSPIPEKIESLPNHENDKQNTQENVKDSDLEALQKQKEQEELQELQSKINSYITANKLDLELKTKLTDEGLLITLMNDTFFNSGSAVVRSADVKLAREISDLLVMDLPRNIIVSGHTDNVPIKNSQFDNNWHLSVIRAVNFMKILLENNELDPQKFSAKGYGEFQPVAPNDTKENKQKNRRVEILILPNR
ncbi:flagellar motor protein MotB [Bacillus timonensis]|nr:flagellar motor protein MotB [Bacillus timonensis]